MNYSLTSDSPVSNLIIVSFPDFKGTLSVRKSDLYVFGKDLQYLISEIFGLSPTFSLENWLLACSGTVEQLSFITGKPLEELIEMDYDPRNGGTEWIKYVHPVLATRFLNTFSLNLGLYLETALFNIH